MKLRVSYCAALGALMISAAALGADWPQWRGPRRDGLSQEKGLLKQWPKEGPKLLWQVKDLGYGYGSLAVAGDRIYLLGNEGLENESVRALSVADGKTLWSTRLGKVGNPDQSPNYPAARSTPTVEGDVLYVLSSDGDLASLEASSGKIRWQKNVRREFGGQPGTWAYAESPLIDGDTLVVTPGGSEATLVALNKKTGGLIWKAPVPGSDPAGYASVTVVEGGGRKQYVQFLGKGVASVDAKTGQFLWRYDQTSKGPANMPTPVSQNGFVYSAAQRIGGALLRLKATSGGVEAEQVYFERGLPNNIGGSVLVGEFMYGTSGPQMLAMEFTTGKVRWQNDSIGAGSLLYADGHLYLHGENGEVALIEATPEAYREKGRFTPPDPPKRLRGAREMAWTYPVVANGRLYIRDVGTLWCYQVRP